MGLATLDDIVAVDDDQQQPNVASFDDIVSIEPPPAPTRNLASFADILSIEPPAPAAARPEPSALTPLEQAVVDASPPRVKPTFVDLYKPPAPPAPPVDELRPGRMAGLADTAPRSTTRTVIDGPIEGVPQVIRGARALPSDVVSAARPFLENASGRQTPRPSLGAAVDPAMNDVSDIAEGSFKTLEPAMIAGAVTNPITTAAALTAAGVAQTAAEKGVQATGGSPAAARLAGNVAAILAGGPAAAAGHAVEGRVGARLFPERVAEGSARAETPLPVPETARPPAPPAAAEPPVVVPETPAAPAPVAPGVASVDDIVAIEPPQGASDAVPVPPANAVDVRQPPTDGAAVGGGDAERPGAAGPSAEGSSAPREEAEPAGPGEAPAVGTAHVDDVVAVEPPAPTGTAHVSDVVAVEPPQTSAASPDRAPETMTRSDIRAELAWLRRLQQDKPAQFGDAERARAQALNAEFRARRQSVPAEPAELTSVDRDTRRELRRILAEMQEVPYTGKSFTKAGVGHGGDLEVTGGAGGAPVYWDIVGGNADSGRATFKYSRSDVAHKLKAFLETGKRSVASDLAVDVARRRLAGEQGLQEAVLPPNAGDLPGAIYAERRDGLDAERAAVEERARAQAEDHGPELVAAYRKKFDNVVGADQAKELLSDYATPEQRTANDLAVHNTARAVRDRVFDEVLRERPQEGRQPVAVFTSGGTGSGKSTSLDIAAPGMRQASHVIYDSTLSHFDTAVQHIEKALNSGFNAAVVFTDREVLEAFRATLRRATEHGRPVDLNTHLSTHERAPQVFQQLREHYANDPNVEFLVIRNSAAGREVVPLDEWTPRRYNRGDVEAHLRRVLAEEHGAGRISDAVRDAVAPGGGLEAAREAEPLRRENGARVEDGEPAPARPGEVQPGLPPGRDAEEAPRTREVTDTLDTGERQPRLPGAEDARQAGKADTSFRAPRQASGDDFSLDSETTDDRAAADDAAEKPKLFEMPARRDGAPVVTIREKRFGDQTGLPEALKKKDGFTVSWQDEGSAFPQEPRRRVRRARAVAGVARAVGHPDREQAAPAERDRARALEAPRRAARFASASSSSTPSASTSRRNRRSG
jgi:hypothetical protein